MSFPLPIIPYPCCSGCALLRPFLSAWFFLLILLSAAPPAALAENAVISNLILSSQNDYMTAHLRIEGAFTQKIEAVVKSGVPATFSYFLILETPRSFLPAKTLANITVTHTIRYNAIRENYTVTRSWEEFTPHVFKDFREAQKTMCAIANLPIGNAVRMEKGQGYRLRAKAKLSELTLPLYLHHILFFLTFWDFETDWYSIDFTF